LHRFGCGPTIRHSGGSIAGALGAEDRILWHPGGDIAQRPEIIGRRLDGRVSSDDYLSCNFDELQNLLECTFFACRP
jgi:hypothetical protein